MTTMLQRTGSAAVLSALLAVAPAAAAAPATLPPAAQVAVQRLVEGARDSHSDTLLVTRGGQEVARLGDVDAPIELMSATKSVVALGIGQLVGDGRIESLDQPVSDFYPEWKQGRKRDITVRMLLDHTSGLQNVPRAPVEIYPAPDVVQLALAAELDSAPGEAFSYNNKAVNLLAGIIAKATGQPMDGFFRDGLFAALDITPGPWEKDAAGNPHAMSGLPLSARDAAKIGRLVLDRGRVRDGQPVPAAFIDTMLAPSARTAEAGLLWWRRPAWERLTPDPDGFATLRERGVPDDLVERLRQVVGGRSFDSADVMGAALVAGLGEDLDRVREAFAGAGVGPGVIFEREHGPVVAYEANGYLGQYIVVVPAADLVAVRQYKARGDGEQPPADGYPEFTRRVIDLARALEPTVPAAPAAR